MKQSDFLLILATIWVAPHASLILSTVMGIGLVVFSAYHRIKGD